jgi:hypothetical protein
MAGSLGYIMEEFMQFLELHSPLTFFLYFRFQCINQDSLQLVILCHKGDILRRHRKQAIVVSNRRTFRVRIQCAYFL